MSFYDPGRAGEVAVNLFNGYGYNFYRLENQLRADDQLVRTTAAGLLGQARAAVDAAESAYRREHLPPPTRAQPFPPAEAVAAAQALERLARDIGALEGRVRTQPAPANDRMTQLYRQEADTLARLIERDKLLVGEAELLREAVAGADGEALLAKAGEVRARMDAIAEALRERCWCKPRYLPNSFVLSEVEAQATRTTFAVLRLRSGRTGLGLRTDG